MKFLHNKKRTPRGKNLDTFCRGLQTRWATMMSRCYNPNRLKYKDYGARGIKVCEDWHDIRVFAKWCKENGYHPDFITDPVFEQCTGLKDKNGNLIYENDVVYDSVYENKFIVSWDEDRTGYILSANNTNHIDYLSKILIERHNLKIIGNIHETKE